MGMYAEDEEKNIAYYDGLFAAAIPRGVCAGFLIQIFERGRTDGTLGG